VDIQGFAKVLHPLFKLIGKSVSHDGTLPAQYYLHGYISIFFLLFITQFVTGYAPLGARQYGLEELPSSALDHIRCKEENIHGCTGANLYGLLVHSNKCNEEDLDIVLVYLQGKLPTYYAITIEGPY
jgi:hypothetical protein